jgi:hypothetical protein
MFAGFFLILVSYDSNKPAISAAKISAGEAVPAPETALRRGETA